MNHPQFFEIQCDDLKRAIAFYSAAFNWEFTLQEGLPIEYYDIKTAGINGGLLPRPVSVQPHSGTNAAVISMQVNDFDTTAKVILAHGGREALPKFAVPGRCWQGYFLDTEGNTFGLFEVDSAAQ